MNRLFRLLYLLLRSRWAPRCPTLGPCITRLRVWPNDLDVFLHVNNGVYLTLCDLARVDLMLRSGALGFGSGRHLAFLVAAETVQLYQPLKLLQRFYIETHVLGWDDRAFFVQHRFWVPAGGMLSGDESGVGQRTVAVAVVEGRVHDRRRGKIPPEAMLGDLGISIETRPALPDWVERWRTDQRALRQVNRSTSTEPAT